MSHDGSDACKISRVMREIHSFGAIGGRHEFHESSRIGLLQNQLFVVTQISNLLYQRLQPAECDRFQYAQFRSRSADWNPRPRRLEVDWKSALRLTFLPVEVRRDKTREVAPARSPGMRSEKPVAVDVIGEWNGHG